MKELFINRRGDFYKADERGYLSRTTRDGFTVNPSPYWKIEGAVEYRKVFGNDVVTRRYTLRDILDGKVPFRYKNGKQRCYIRDYDHGAYRVWSDSHDVRVIDNSK